ncbi:hypothetical protein [Aestuariispira ectoiniformans]|uniref:hypothetical protein n=1 Tax=Aestuariispira ectoiniformans TaxID=2775080 RepID=UPI00223BC64B|nr:hypothetical protein [Aestuariispira ectoiniformans]
MLQTPAAHGALAHCVVSSDFASYDQHYSKRLSGYLEKLQRAARNIQRLDEAGIATHASQQLFIHAKWLSKYTAYWSRLDALLERLESSFLEFDQDYVANQSPYDGSWGWHYKEFHHKFDATIGRLHELEERQAAPQFALDFLEPVSTRNKMIEYLERLRVSDIAATGRNQRDEFGAVLTCLGQICFKSGLRNYVQQHVKGIDLDQDYIDSFREFLDQSQNPETGYWGPWYKSNGRIHRYDDLSFTFHVISYRKGQVNHWPEIIDTTFANKAKSYPRGWLHDGRYNNHNNYDVAKIFRFGWPQMTAAERTRASTEIQHMLDYCLDRSMDDEGRFHMDSKFYNSQEAAYYFGVSFLEEAGYFDPDRRFWTDRAFPENKDVIGKIRNQLDQLNPSHDHVTAARWKLEKSQPRTTWTKALCGLSRKIQQGIRHAVQRLSAPLHSHITATNA